MRRLPITALATLQSILLLSCQSSSPQSASLPEESTTSISNSKTVEAEVESQAPGIDVDFLLSMTYEEAKALGQKSLELQPFCKIVADEIHVLRQTPEGIPLRVTAKGKVFIEISSGQTMVALAHEVYVDRGNEIRLRGQPLLKHGNSVVEGLKSDTLFLIQGSKLQVVGQHRVPQLKFEIPSLAPESGPRETWDVTPNWRESWQAGPNPLLPALAPDEVPAGLSGSILLPELGENSPVE